MSTSVVARAAALVLAASSIVSGVLPSQAAAAVLGRVTASKPRAVAVDGDRLFIAEQDGRLTVVDTPSYSVIERIDLSCCLSDVAAGLGKIWVAGNGILVLDQQTLELEQTISVGNGFPDTLIVDPVAERVYVALSNLDVIAVIDPALGSIVASWPAGDRPEDLALRGSTLYVVNAGDESVTAIDTSSGLTVATALVPQPVAVVSGGVVVYVATRAGAGAVEVRDANNLGLVRSMWTGNVPNGLAFNSLNGRLWVPDAASATTAMMRSSDGIVLGRIPMGQGLGDAAFDVVRGRVYVAAFTSDEVVALGEGPGIVDILTPFEGGFMGPSTRVLTGTAPAGSPVTVTENGGIVGFTYAGDQSRWSMNVDLPEGPHTLIASVPEERPSAPRTITVDLTPPDVVETYRTPPNAAGWNNGAVVVRWSCTDASSGTTTPVLERVVGVDGRNVTLSVKCSDRAGNVREYHSTGFNLDRTPPVIGLLHTPAKNAFGWNNTSPVNVTMNCVDVMSGVSGPVSYSESVSGNTAGRDVTFVCRDVAGNVRTRIDTVRIDQIKPTAVIDDLVLIAGPKLAVSGVAQDGLSVPLSAMIRFTNSSAQDVFVPAECAAQCGSSRMQFAAEPPPLLVPGVYQVSVRAFDRAGNAGDWSAPRAMAVVGTVPPGLVPIPAIPTPSLP